MVNPLANSSYLDFTSHGTTTATSVFDAYQFTGPVTAAPTVNVALVLPRANDPTALLAGDWASRQTTLQQLEDNGTLWSTYGASSADYTNTLTALNGLGITVIGDATGSGGYVTSQESRTIWVQLTATQFGTFFGTSWQQAYSEQQQGTLYYWDNGLSVPDGLNVKGVWFDTWPIWGTYPAVTDMSGGAQVTPPQGPLSIGNNLYNTNQSVTNYAGDIADRYYNFPLAGIDAPTATIGLVEPGIGDAIPAGSNYTFTEGFNSFRRNAGYSTPGDYYVVAHNGQSYEWGNGAERSLDVGVVISATPGSRIGLYAGSGFNGNIAMSNAYTAFQASFWDHANNPAVVSSSYSIFQQSAPDSPFAYAVRELFIDAGLRNITMVEANNDWGSGWNFANGLANQAINVSSPYLLSIGGTSLSTFASAPLDSTISTTPYPSQALYGLAMAGDLATIWRLVQGGLTVLPHNVGADAAEKTFLESVWNSLSLTGNSLQPSFGMGDGGVDTTQSTPSYQTAFGLNPTTVNPGGGTGRGTPDVSANSGGNMLYAGPNWDMAPGPTPSGGYWGTSAATPLWASLIAQIDTIFHDQGLPNLGYANDLIYKAAAVAPASFNDITYGNNVMSFLNGGPIDNNGTAITLTGYGYYAGPGYDLTTGLGSPNGTLLARALTAIGHSQMHDSSPDMLDLDGQGGWRSGAEQSLMFQAMSAHDARIELTLGSQSSSFSSPVSDTYAWTSRFAQQSLQSDFDADLVRLYDKQALGVAMQTHLSQGEHLGVSINSASAQAVQGTLTADFGFADFQSSSGAVRVARPVAVAETAGGRDDATAIVRLRQNGEDSLSLTFYRVDDLSGSIAGLRPGDAGYAAAAQARAYHLVGGGTSINGPGYGEFLQTGLTNIDAGDLVAMKLVNHKSGDTFWGFSQGNEVVAGEHVGHLWSYGLNTWGWEDLRGGGDRDFNDLVVQLDFTSHSGHNWLV